MSVYKGQRGDLGLLDQLVDKSYDKLGVDLTVNQADLLQVVWQAILK